jgi:hypothetical protein
MLGIRQYRGAAIDLWQGDPEEFACDLVSDEILSGLSSSLTNRYRHLAITPRLNGASATDQTTYAQAAMSQIKKFLEEQPEESFPKRVTVILPDATQYDLFQKFLFETFADHA